MAKKGVSKKGGQDINLEVAKTILAAVSNNQESVSFGNIDNISQTDLDSVNGKINKLLYSGEENPYSLQRILVRRKFGKEENVGERLDQQLEDFKSKYLELMNGVSKHPSSPPPTGFLPEVLSAGPDSVQDSIKSDSSVTSEGSYNISNSNSSAKKRVTFSRIIDSLAKICDSSKKEDSLHGSVTADFVVGDNNQGVFERAEERMVREQDAKAKRLEEQRRMKEEVLKRQKELEKQRKKEERLEQKTLKQNLNQASKEKGPSMFERFKGYLKGFKAPEALVVKTYSRNRGEKIWHKTSETEIGREELGNAANAVARGAGSTVKGAAEVAKIVGAGLRSMTTEWEEGATGPIDVARSAAKLMKTPGASIGENFTSVAGAAQFMVPNGPPSAEQMTSAAKGAAGVVKGVGSFAGKALSSAASAARNTSVTIGGRY